jgi:hypothetical protein
MNENTAALSFLQSFKNASTELGNHEITNN